MLNQNLIRQLDIIPMAVLDTKITVIGAGAVGSHTVKALCQMGFHDVTVFDDDLVETENMNAQGYGQGHLGMPKVTALAKIVKEYSGIDITAKAELYRGGRFDGIVISAVDNMATRRLIWEQHKGAGINTVAVIDPRMGAEIAIMYAMNPMNPHDQESYEKTLHDDNAAVMEPCTAKATIYTALLLSGMVCKAVKDTVTNHRERYPRIMMWNIRNNDCEFFCPAIEEKAAEVA